MPCDSTYKVKIKFGENTELSLLAKALEEMGFVDIKEWRGVLKWGKINRSQYQYYSASIDGKTGIITKDDRMALDMEELQMGYARQVVENQAQEMGWDFEQNPDDKNKLRIRRRI